MMNLSVNESYKIALASNGAELSAPALRTYISAIKRACTDAGIQPGDQVIVWVTKDEHVMAVIWALIHCKATCIPVNPAIPDIDIKEMATRTQAKHIITEKQWRRHINIANVLFVEDCLAATAGIDLMNAGAGNNLPFIFYEHAGKNFRELSGNVLNAYLSRLDTCLPAIQDGWMLLDKNIPYDRMIMGILWASSRGIPLILDPLNKEDLLKPGFKMDFGLFYFGNFIETDDQGKYNLLFETVHFADKNGFTAVWTPERHFNEFGGLYPNPSVLSAALAVATTAVQIRSGSLVVPLHHPVRVAEDWALVDNLSKGRVAISFASGWQCDDFIFYPEHYADRHACMLNQIDIIKRLWRGENVAFRNGLGKEIDISVYPKPLQKELPVWITVSARIETFIDAGKIGANILTHLLWQNTDELIEKIAAYRRSLQENGFDPRSKIVSVMVHTFLGHHNDTVKEKVRAPLKHYIKSSTQLIQSMIRSNSQQNNSKEVGGRYGSVEGEVPGHLLDELAEIAFNRFFDQAALLGTIEKAKKLIEKLRSYDVDEVACLIDFGIHKKDIMEGLTYLNELRKQYESNNFSKYPVKIIHCQPDKLHYCTTNKSFANINAILAEAKSFEDIPEPWVHKTKIIYDPSSSQTTWEVRIEENNVSINNADALFSETINEEF